MTFNEGNYICNATNKAGADESIYQIHVIPYHSTKKIDHNIIPAASSDSQISSSRSKINVNESKRWIIYSDSEIILLVNFQIMITFCLVLCWEFCVASS